MVIWELIVALCAVGVTTRRLGSEDGSTSVKAYLIVARIHSIRVALVVPVDHLIALHLKDIVAARGAVTMNVTLHHILTCRSDTVLIDLVARLVPNVVVRVHIVGMSREDMRFVELVEQLQKLLTVGSVANLTVIEYRNMDAEDNHLALRHNRQVLLEPLVLLGRESRYVIAHRDIALILHVAHRNNMHIATIERVVNRTKALLEVALQLDMEVAITLVREGWF